jgi:hypothetical protein
MRIGKSMIGTTRSSATSWILNTSTPVSMPMRSQHGDQHFHRRVAGAGAQAGHGGVDAVGAGFDGGDAELATPMARLWWPWKPSSVSGLSASRTAADARLDVVGQHVAGRVGDVDAVGAVALHQPGLLDQAFGLFMCAIIRKPTVSMSSLRAR